MVLDPLGRFLGLPPPVARRVDVTRRIPVRMRDGTILRTDHYAPDLPGAPTVLVRTPYGRGGPTSLLCRAVAERGFHVVLQSCRGTGGSGGAFEPMLHERDDGLDTVDWLRRQPWYDGRLLHLRAELRRLRPVGDRRRRRRASSGMVTSSPRRASPTRPTRAARSRSTPC